MHLHFSIPVSSFIHLPSHLSPGIDYLDWNIEEYASASNNARPTFPAPKLGCTDQPATVVDCKGRIILWYLPGLLLPHRQVNLQIFYKADISKALSMKVELFRSMHHIAKKMSLQVKVPHTDIKVSWRKDPNNFAEAHPSRSFPTGVETYSAGWFAQGHSIWVSLPLHLALIINPWSLDRKMAPEALCELN